MNFEDEIAGVFKRIAKEAGLTASKIVGKCRACGQKNRWDPAKTARCGKCGIPLPEVAKK